MPMRNNTARVGEERVPCSPIIHSSLAQSQSNEISAARASVGLLVWIKNQEKKLTMKRRAAGPSLASALPLGTAAGHPARHGWFGCCSAPLCANGWAGRDKTWRTFATCLTFPFLPGRTYDSYVRARSYVGLRLQRCKDAKSLISGSFM